MKQFFKFTFASLLGFFIGIFILFLVFAGIIAAAMSFGDKETEVKEKTILHLKFDQPIPDRSPKNPFANFSPGNFEPVQTLGLDEILESIEKASRDSRIKGIYLEFSGIPAYMATIEEIRNALLEFKSSGKFIIAYGDNADQKAYYLASVADRIYMNPEGMLLFNGLAGQVMFIRGTLEKLGIEAQVIRHGKFKSAIEPLIQDEMSPANEEQVLTYISALWDHMVMGISESRGISVEVLNAYADSLEATFTEDAVNLGMLDALKYENEMLEELADSVGTEKTKDLELLSLAKYVNVELEDDEKEGKKDKIAVIFAEGDIVDGKAEDGSVGGKSYAALIRKAREDEKVKAVVLRVNSPGGSSFASEEIHHEIELTRAVKPVVASYGGVAASGGYYISCGADSILASPNTITGSIGVFGVIPNMQKLFNDKLGITFDQVMTNHHADFMSVYRPMNKMEEALITRMIEDVYSTFIQRVGDGRGMETADVDSIGQGRVWAGSDALELGLIDGYGGLQDAIEMAARMAGTTEYRVKKYPEIKDPFEKIMESLGGSAQSWMVKRELGEFYPAYRALKQLQSMQGVQARMEYDVVIE